MITATDLLRAAIQKVLDVADCDGWQVHQFVISIGLERMNSDGRVENTPWVMAPEEQPDWQTDGLLRAAIELREEADIDTD